jgi:hypothetical protein
MTDRTIISNQRANNNNSDLPQSPRVFLGQRRLAADDQQQQQPQQPEKQESSASVNVEREQQAKPREKNAPVIHSERFNWGQPATLKTSVVYRVLRCVARERERERF